MIRILLKISKIILGLSLCLSLTVYADEFEDAMNKYFAELKKDGFELQKSGESDEQFQKRYLTFISQRTEKHLASMDDASFMATYSETKSRVRLKNTFKKAALDIVGQYTADYKSCPSGQIESGTKGDRPAVFYSCGDREKGPYVDIDVLLEINPANQTLKNTEDFNQNHIKYDSHSVDQLRVYAFEDFNSSQQWFLERDYLARLKTYRSLPKNSYSNKHNADYHVEPKQVFSQLLLKDEKVSDDTQRIQVKVEIKYQNLEAEQSDASALAVRMGNEIVNEIFLMEIE